MAADGGRAGSFSMIPIIFALWPDGDIMKWTPIAIVPALLTATLACSDDPADPVEDCGSDIGSVNATVTVGPSVTIDWTPPCALALLLVELDASDQWVIASAGFESDDPAGANTIFPPVTYGVVPTGAIESETPAQLIAGMSYDVALWRFLPAGSATQCLLNFDNACLVANPSFVR